MPLLLQLQLFQCPDCLIEFNDCASMFQHLRQPHTNDYKRYGHLTDDFHEAESEDEVAGPVDESDCVICKYSLGSAPSGRKRHYENWHRSGHIQCTHCTTAHFRTRWQLAVHLANQHRIDIEQDCRKCDKSHSYYRRFDDGRYFMYHYTARNT